MLTCTGPEELGILANSFGQGTRTLITLLKMPSLCGLCNCRFSSDKLLQAHTCRHTKLHYCTACGISFPHRADLLKHLKTARNCREQARAGHRIAPSVRVPFKSIKGTRTAGPEAYVPVEVARLGKPASGDLTHIPNPILIGERIIEFRKTPINSKALPSIRKLAPEMIQGSLLPRKHPNGALESGRRDTRPETGAPKTRTAPPTVKNSPSTSEKGAMVGRLPKVVPSPDDSITSAPTAAVRSGVMLPLPSSTDATDATPFLSDPRTSIAAKDSATKDPLPDWFY